MSDLGLDNVETDKEKYVCPLSKYRNFLLEWIAERDQQVAWRVRAAGAIEKVNTIHDSIANIHRDTQFLNQLPSIATTNKSLSDNFANLCSKFETLEAGSLEAALGRKQVPISIFFTVVFILGSIILLKEIGSRGFEASGPGAAVKVSTPERSMHGP